MFGLSSHWSLDSHVQPLCNNLRADHNGMCTNPGNTWEKAIHGQPAVETSPVADAHGHTDTHARTRAHTLALPLRVCLPLPPCLTAHAGHTAPPSHLQTSTQSMREPPQ